MDKIIFAVLFLVIYGFFFFGGWYLHSEGRARVVRVAIIAVVSLILAGATIVFSGALALGGLF